MKIDEAFSVPYPLETVWAFFDTEVALVARCVPGLEDFQDLGDDRYRVRVTQKVGSMGATFDLKAQLDEKDELRWFQFSAIGRSVKGAVADLRSKNRLELEAAGERTDLVLHAEVVLGGMAGSLGYRVIGSKSTQVISEFVTNVTAALADWASTPGSAP